MSEQSTRRGKVDSLSQKTRASSLIVLVHTLQIEHKTYNFGYFFKDRHAVLVVTVLKSRFSCPGSWTSHGSWCHVFALTVSLSTQLYQIQVLSKLSGKPHKNAVGLNCGSLRTRPSISSDYQGRKQNKIHSRTYCVARSLFTKERNLLACFS